MRGRNWAFYGTAVLERQAFNPVTRTERRGTTAGPTTRQPHCNSPFNSVGGAQCLLGPVVFEPFFVGFQLSRWRLEPGCCETTLSRPKRDLSVNKSTLVASLFAGQSMFPVAGLLRRSEYYGQS